MMNFMVSFYQGLSFFKRHFISCTAIYGIALIIQPTYSAMDMDGPLQNIPLTKNFDNLEYRVDKRYLFEVIKDYTNEYDN